MRRRELLLLAAAGCLGAWWQLRSQQAEPVAEIVRSSAPSSSPVTTRIAQTASSPLDSLPSSPLLLSSPRYPTESPEKAYLSDRVMLRVEDAASLLAVARDHGTQVQSLPGPSGYAALWIPPDTSLAAMRADLLADERVLDASPVGVMRGASTGLPAQWQDGATSAYDVDPTDTSGIVVAVLDSGVAYESYSDAGVTYVQAVGLAGVDIVAPWDFVNGDAHANDDHQHGTHIACTIACEGAVPGYAPGTSLMPIKVLSADNSGVETDLVDAIWHAIDNGADVINMSLSFGQGYTPSAALSDALLAADDAGIVLLAASGNDGSSFTSFPAAHPVVFAVAATALKHNGTQQPVGYSNRDPAVDFAAPGGDLDADENGDGYPDGILAETIAYQDPSTTGYWFYAGTSQATAVASGAAAILLAEGASQGEVYAALQLGAKGLADDIVDGLGMGALDMEKSVKALTKGNATPAGQYYVAMLPWLKDLGSEIEPTVLVTVLDGGGSLVADAAVYGVWVDQDGTSTVFDCTTTVTGQCSAAIAAVPAYDGGDELAWAWSVRVPTLLINGVAVHPGSAFFATDGLELLLTALDGTGIATSPLGLKWDRDAGYPGFDDPADAYVFPNLGTGIATSPLGVIATPPFIEPHATMGMMDLDLDGTGIATSPLGVVQLPRLIFDGTGIATSPLGLQPMTIIHLGGVGIATSPLGFTPPDLLDPHAPSFQDPAMGFNHDPILLGGTGIATSPLGVLGGHTGGLVNDGGWSTTEGYGLGTALQGSGLAGFEGVAGSGVMVASGAGSEPLD
jgi:hypothetical protein